MIDEIWNIQKISILSSHGSIDSYIVEPILPRVLCVSVLRVDSVLLTGSE